MNEMGRTPVTTENVRHEIALSSMDVKIILKWLNK
jgi:hypothetical protein